MCVERPSRHRTQKLRMIEVMLVLHSLRHDPCQVVEVTELVVHEVIVVLEALLKLLRHLKEHISHTLQVVLACLEEIQTVS